MRLAPCLILAVILQLPPTSAEAIANPAAVFCVESGGRHEMRR